MTGEATRIRAYHAGSGSVLNGDVLEIWPGEPGHTAYRVVPDGLLEAVVVREETWNVTVTETVGAPS